MPAEPVTLDVFLVTLLVPPDLPVPAVTAIRRVLARPAVAARLRAAVEAVFRRYRALAPVTVTLSR